MCSTQDQCYDLKVFRQMSFKGLGYLNESSGS